jgi:polyisoprenoid-binding protein YceI
MPTYALDPSHTSLIFAVHGLLPTRGQFTRVDGSITTDERDEPLELEVLISTHSLRTRLSLRDMHLKTASFFDARHYPVISYRSQHIEQAGMNRYIVHGFLRLHGHERAVPLAIHIDPVAQRAGARRARVTGTLPRSAFAIPRNPLLSASMKAMMSDEVTIMAELVATVVPQGSVATPFAADQPSE